MLTVASHGIISSYWQGYSVHWSMMTGKTNTRATDSFLHLGFFLLFSFYFSFCGFILNHQLHFTLFHSSLSITLRWKHGARRHSFRTDTPIHGKRVGCAQSKTTAFGVEVHFDSHYIWNYCMEIGLQDISPAFATDFEKF